MYINILFICKVGGMVKKAFIFFLTAIISCSAAMPAWAWTSEGYGWVKGTLGWSFMIDGIYLDGWRVIEGKAYYFYKDSNFMAHDTIIDGRYINSDGAATSDIPDGISKIMKIDMDYINKHFNNFRWWFYVENNVNFKELCRGNYNVPDINGNIYWLKDDFMDYNGYFVSGDDVYILGNQGGMDIYKIEDNKVVQRIPYILDKSYEWR